MDLRKEFEEYNQGLDLTIDKGHCVYKNNKTASEYLGFLKGYYYHKNKVLGSLFQLQQQIEGDLKSDIIL